MTERWGIKQIADYMGLKPRTVTDKVSKRPDFPKPKARSSQRVRWWEADDVRRYFSNLAKQ